MAAAQVQQEYHMLFETPAAEPDAVTRWRNRVLRFVLPPEPNAPEVVNKPAAGKESEGEVTRQCKQQAAPCCALLSHDASTATCCTCCLHCAMIPPQEQISTPAGHSLVALLAADANVWCGPRQWHGCVHCKVQPQQSVADQPEVAWLLPSY